METLPQDYSIRDFEFVSNRVSLKTDIGRNFLFLSLSLSVCVCIQYILCRILNRDIEKKWRESHGGDGHPTSGTSQ